MCTTYNLDVVPFEKITDFEMGGGSDQLTNEKTDDHDWTLVRRGNDVGGT